MKNFCFFGTPRASSPTNKFEILSLNYALADRIQRENNRVAGSPKGFPFGGREIFKREALRLSLERLFGKLPKAIFYRSLSAQK